MQVVIGTTFRLTMLFLFLTGMAASMYAGDFTWKTNRVGSWHEPDNWSPSGVPGPGDVAIFPTNNTTVARASLDSVDVTIAKLVLDGDNVIAATGAKLTVTSEIQWFDGDFAGDTLSAAVEDTLELSAGGTFTISGTGSRTISNFHIINNGTVTWSSSGVITLTRGSIFENSAGAVFDIQNDRTIKATDPDGGTIIVNGTLSKSMGSGKTFIETDFINNGTVSVSSGSIQIEGAGSATRSTFNVLAGSELIFRFGPMVLDSAIFSGDGLITLNDGVMDLGSRGVIIDTAVTVTMTGSGSAISGDGDLILNGTMTWNRGVISGGGDFFNNNILNVNGTSPKTLGRNFTNNATVNWSEAGDWRIQDGAVVLNTDSATVNITGDATLDFFNSGGSLTNEGVITKSGGTGITTFDVPAVNNGTVNINSGRIHLTQSNGDTSGVFNIAAGAWLEVQNGTHDFTGNTRITGAGTFSVISGTVTIDGTYDGTGEVRIAGGVVTFSSLDTLNNLTMTGGKLTGTGALVVNGFFDWQAGDVEGSGGLTLNGPTVITGGTSATKFILGQTITNNDTITWSGTGDLRLSDDAEIVNADSAAFYIETNANILEEFGAVSGGTITNHGLIAKRNSNSTTTVEANIQNFGELSIQSGSFRMSEHALTNESSGVISGSDTLHVASASAFTNRGTFAPGTSFGILTVNDDYTSTSTSVVEIEIGGTTPGTEYDRLNILDIASLAGTLNFSVADNYRPLPTDTFYVVTFGSRSGQFSQVNNTGGGSFTSGFTGTSFYLTNIDLPNTAPMATDDQFAIDEDVVAVLNVLANDKDIDSDPLTVSLLTTPLNGTAVTAGDTAFQYTPNTDFFGADSFNYIVNDGQGGLDTATVRITVNAVNDAPVVAGIPDISFDENNGATLDLDNFASDVDDNLADLTWTSRVIAVQRNAEALAPVRGQKAAAAAEGETAMPRNKDRAAADTSDLQISIDPATHVATFSATTLGQDVYTVVFTATDPGALADSDTLQVTVTGTTSPPLVVNPIADLTLPEDSAPVQVVADLNTVFSNPENNEMTFSAGTDNANITATVSNNSLTVSVAADFSGSGQVIVTANNTATTNDTFAVTVTPVNDAPVVTGIPDVSFEEDASTTLDMNPYVSDVDNTPAEMTWSAEVLSAQGTFTKTDGKVREVGPDDLNITFDANNVATFSATADSNGVFTVRMIATDPGSLSDDDTITVTITGVLDPPVLASPINDVIFPEDSGPVVVADLATVFTNPEPDAAMTFTAFSNNTNIPATVAGNTLSVTSTQDHTGDAVVIVIADNGSATTASDTFAVTVTPVNDPPVVVLPNITFQEDSVFTLDLDNFANDVDNSDADLLWSAEVLGVTPGIVAGPNDLQIVIDPVTHVASFSVTKDSTGTYTVKFTAQDPGGLADSDTIAVTVTEVFVNTAPAVVNPIADATYPEDSAPQKLPANLNNVFFDPDPGQTLVFSVTSDHPGIQAAIVNDTVQVTLAPDIFGSGKLIVTAVDDSSASAADTVVVTVTPVNDPPVLAAIAQWQTPEDTPFSVDLDDLVSDVDNTLAELVWTVNFVNGTPPGIQVSFDPATHVVTFTPDENVTLGPTPVFVQVCDPENACDEATVTFSITPVNDPPVISGLPQAISFRSDSTASINLWDVVADIETADSLLTYSFSASNDSLLTSYDTQTGELTLSALAGFFGQVQLEITVSDPENAAAKDTVAVTVDPVVGIDGISGQLPRSFAIAQNYPNPFNPATTIRFQLPKASEVSLVIYNLLGQRVRSLIHQRLEAGYHSVSWDGTNDLGQPQATGIYIYRFSSDEGQFVRVMKMILLK